MPSLQARRDHLATRFPTWQPTTIGEHIERCSQLWPDRLALVSGEQWLTYSELERRSSVLAAAFRATGVVPGDRVALLMRNEPDHVAHRIAAARLGAVSVSVNYLLAADELEFVINDAHPRVLVADAVVDDRDILAVIRQLMTAAARGTSIPGGTERRQFPCVVVRGALEGPPLANAMTADEFQLAARDAAAASPAPRPRDVAEICYTSGSTGFPKGVLLTHDALTREGYGTAYRRGFADGWKLLLALPPFHIFGYAQAVLPTTFVGGTTFLQSRFDPEEQLRWLKIGR